MKHHGIHQSHTITVNSIDIPSLSMYYLKYTTDGAELIMRILYDTEDTSTFLLNLKQWEYATFLHTSQDGHVFHNLSVEFQGYTYVHKVDDILFVNVRFKLC